MRTAEVSAAVIAPTGPALIPAAARPAAAETMGGDGSLTIGGSIALIVIGAILRFGITWKPAHVDLGAIGIILMIAGAVGLIISIVFLATRRRGRASAQVYEERRYTEPPS
jgi:hypothetical protein